VKTGTWKELDENNKVISETDYGKPEKKDWSHESPAERHL
jgi:hypothetical protein